VAIALRTSRLLLRPWRDEDIAAFAELITRFNLGSGRL